MKRVAFLMSDTGGGHRAAGRAIEAALALRYPDQFHCDYVDIHREYALPPYKYAPELYPLWVKYSSLTYGWYFAFSDWLFSLPFMGSRLLGFFGSRSLRHLNATYQPDIAVIVHAEFSRFVVGARRRLKLDLPAITVITDLAKPHNLWYARGIDLCVVPCQAAYQRGLKNHIPQEKLRLLGHPAHPKFALYSASKAEARAALGWSPDLPMIMLIGGGDGMGKLDAIAEAINARQLAAQFAIVCGRNEKLKAQLEAMPWQQPTTVYGFVDNVEVLMRAADVLITKAGPGTIAEALVSGVPMVLSGAIPAQETPNIAFVVEGGAGLHAEQPRAIADALADLLAQPDRLAAMTAATAAIAYPNASFDIADEIAARVGVIQGEGE